MEAEKLRLEQARLRNLEYIARFGREFDGNDIGYERGMMQIGC